MSNISLTPASQAFVDNRTTTLGPWVLGAFIDCILLGVVLCQVERFFKLRRSGSRGIHYWYMWIVVLLTVFSLIKTAQAMGVVWMQNVFYFNDPDVARTLLSDAWWQVSVPLMTAVSGVIVQSFFAFRFWLLTRRFVLTLPIVAAMVLGIVGAALSVVNIINGDVKAKVMWLMVHLVSVFLADFMISVGTYVALKTSVGESSSKTTIANRFLRLIFESALPPTILATADLILTQTLGPNLLWHLILNFPLSKVYVISLLYTLNSINEYRRQELGFTDDELYTSKYGNTSQRGGHHTPGSRSIGLGIRPQSQNTTPHQTQAVHCSNHTPCSCCRRRYDP